MKKSLIIVGVLAFSTVVAGATSLSKTYSYFTIGGSTLSQIEEQLKARGPRLGATGQRHPGATNMEFTTKIDYGESDGWCRVQNAAVALNAAVTLPRWRATKSAKQDVRLVWNILERDIKRHEESHIIIAKNHARELENTLLRLPRKRECGAVQKLAETATQRILAKHDAAQIKFDRIEAKNFESRLLRLLDYRLEQMEREALKQ
ncbi:DUF922 domain-containing Zn-dependent protease [Nitratireductor basaltis]|uniref:Peptidase n=1 Tax=Nitratireductor basaltis TaxID=472175 RepID=A0A084UB14_9HYPH|nr:DUF922 domain-containing protein [Nitratireductor basaltis]KFB10150.1 hypothetical protein EL18_01180 [Nitratireductor basaltis]